MTEQEAKQVLESMLRQMEWMPKTESKDIVRDALRIAIEKLDVQLNVTNKGGQNAIQNRIKAVANKPNADWYKY